jgi:hypothetical protein
MNKEWYLRFGWAFIALALIEGIWQKLTTDALLCVVIALLFWILGDLRKGKLP